jgi:N-acetylmuramoyl-L-alanine amidase
VRNLSRGDRGKEVLDVQTRLRGQGHEPGREGADGFFGPSTEAAVRTFQQERDMLADGVVGANTWRELVEAGYALGDRLLYLKEPPFRGDDVLTLQVKLNLEALRKAESGREGKKIPERDGGYVPARSLTGQVVVIDPGHGGTDTGYVSPSGLAEKDFSLALGLRFAELLRAEGCRVRLTRERDDTLALYARAEAAGAAGADCFISLHGNQDRSVAARGAACYYFQRGHYFSEHGRLLAGHLAARLEATGGCSLGEFGRNYGVLRETRAIAVLVEPLFLSNPDEERLARRPSHIEAVARALVGGLTDYLARVRLPGAGT